VCQEVTVTTGYRLGIDIGGTFTDALLLDEQTGEVKVGKVPSTPREPLVGFMAATQRMLEKVGTTPEDIVYVVHGTTIATNAIIEGSVSRTAFVTTAGFRDMLEIARQIRPSLYDLQFQKPSPLVPRCLCFEVEERMGPHGEVVTPLNESSVSRVAQRLKQERVEAVALCFLHSYVNPAHEKRTSEILREMLPGVSVSASCEVAPEFREYFRASTTVINACILPLMSRYIERIESRLRANGFGAQLLAMQSGGGVYTFSLARRKPVFMVESGPAAGVIAATYLGEMAGYSDLLTFDMGGTTAKAALVHAGKPQITKEFEVGATARAEGGATRGGGYPIRTPVVDVVEIGAGGGSIAWVDSGGVLRVGPQSAGADPGPACYGKGGAEPTVTDANLVLGRLSADYFLGGEITLDLNAAEEAIEEKCAGPLDLDTVRAAYAIVEIANHAMTNALRLVSIERGYDPREFVLVAFGGAGPMHANRLASEIHVPTTLVPLGPGVASALGLLVADAKHELSVTLVRQGKDLDPVELEARCRELEERGRAMLIQDRIPASKMRFRRQAEIRYVGQSYELAVDLPGGINQAEIDRAIARFHDDHERTYGFSAPSEPVELVNLRVVAVGLIAKPEWPELEPGDVSWEAARKGSRSVFFSEHEGFIDCPIIDRYRLGREVVLPGPAIVEEVDSTTVLHPGYQATVDRFGSLLITRSP
jgi:N-methylhydantoinase A